MVNRLQDSFQKAKNKYFDQYSSDEDNLEYPDLKKNVFKEKIEDSKVENKPKPFTPPSSPHRHKKTKDKENAGVHEGNEQVSPKSGVHKEDIEPVKASSPPLLKHKKFRDKEKVSKFAKDQPSTSKQALDRMVERRQIKSESETEVKDKLENSRNKKRRHKEKDKSKSKSKKIKHEDNSMENGGLCEIDSNDNVKKIKDEDIDMFTDSDEEINKNKKKFNKSIDDMLKYASSISSPESPKIQPKSKTRTKSKYNDNTNGKNTSNSRSSSPAPIRNSSKTSKKHKMHSVVDEEPAKLYSHTNNNNHNKRKHKINKSTNIDKKGSEKFMSANKLSNINNLNNYSDSNAGDFSSDGSVIDYPINGSNIKKVNKIMAVSEKLSKAKINKIKEKSGKKSKQSKTTIGSDSKCTSGADKNNSKKPMKKEMRSKNNSMSSSLNTSRSTNVSSSSGNIITSNICKKENGTKSKIITSHDDELDEANDLQSISSKSFSRSASPLPSIYSSHNTDEFNDSNDLFDKNKNKRLRPITPDIKDKFDLIKERSRSRTTANSEDKWNRMNSKDDSKMDIGKQNASQIKNLTLKDTIEKLKMKNERNKERYGLIDEIFGVKAVTKKVEEKEATTNSEKKPVTSAKSSNKKNDEYDFVDELPSTSNGKTKTKNASTKKGIPKKPSPNTSNSKKAKNNSNSKKKTVTTNPLDIAKEQAKKDFDKWLGEKGKTNKSNTVVDKKTNSANMEALEFETEQTLKDINKWLECTPRYSEFNSASNSPSRYILDELDPVTSKIDTNDFHKSNTIQKSQDKQKSDMESNKTTNNDFNLLKESLTHIPNTASPSHKPPITTNNGRTTPPIINSNTPTTTPSNSSPITNSTKKDTRESKRKSLKEKLNHIQKKRETPRHNTIDRLQPGKTKGNLINTLQNSHKQDELTPSNNNILNNKTKEIKNSLIVKTSEFSPKLNLGTVLDTEGFGLIQQHNFSDEPNNDSINKIESEEDDDEDEDKIEKKKIEEKKNGGNEQESEELEKKKDEDDDVVMDIEKDISVKEKPEPKINITNTEKTIDKTTPTPNLNAWFKAFGAPKKSKKAEEVNDKPASDQFADKQNAENKTLDPIINIQSTVIPSLESPNYPAPTMRQRKASTGSTISERSSFSQDPDSPRIGIDERLYPVPFQSPLDNSGTLPSPKPEEVSKVSPYPLNGAIKVGFYQDTTTKSSPEKSCSPRDLPPSPYPQYSQHLYSTQAASAAATNNLYGGYPYSQGLATQQADKSLMNYGKDAKISPVPQPIPFYDQYKQPRSQESDYNSMSPSTNQNSPYHNQTSPYQQQPNSPYQNNAVQTQQSFQPSSAAGVPSPAVPIASQNAGQAPNSPYASQNSPYQKPEQTFIPTSQPPNYHLQTQTQQPPQPQQLQQKSQPSIMHQSPNSPFSHSNHSSPYSQHDPNSPYSQQGQMSPFPQPTMSPKQPVQSQGNMPNNATNSLSQNNAAIPINNLPQNNTVVSHDWSQMQMNQQNMLYNQGMQSHMPHSNIPPQAHLQQNNINTMGNQNITTSSNVLNTTNTQPAHTQNHSMATGYLQNNYTTAFDFNKKKPEQMVGNPQQHNQNLYCNNKTGPEMINLGYADTPDMGSKPQQDIPINMGNQNLNKIDNTQKAQLIDSSKSVENTKMQQHQQHQHQHQQQQQQHQHQHHQQQMYDRLINMPPYRNETPLDFGKPGDISKSKAMDMFNHVASMSFSPIPRPIYPQSNYSTPSNILPMTTARKPEEVTKQGDLIGKTQNYQNSTCAASVNNGHNTSTHNSTNNSNQVNKSQMSTPDMQAYTSNLQMQSTKMNVGGQQDLVIPNPRGTQVDHLNNSQQKVPDLRSPYDNRQTASANQQSNMNLGSYKTPSFNTASPSLMDITRSGLALSTIMRDYQPDDRLLSLPGTPPGGYYDKNIPNAHIFAKNIQQVNSTAALQQMFSSSMTTMAYNSNRDQQNHAVNYPSRLQPPANIPQQQTPAQPVPETKPAKKPKKPSKKALAAAAAAAALTAANAAQPPNTEMINQQNIQQIQQHGFQSYAGLKTSSTTQANSDSSAISLKSASVVPGSAFNFGPTPPGLGLPTGIYGDNTGYLDEYRGTPSSYYLPPSGHRNTPDPSGEKSNNTTPAHPPPAASPFHQFIPHPSSRSSYPFMNQLDPIHHQFMRQEEYTRTHSMMVNHGILGPGASGTYPQPGYHPALGMHKPYDAMNRPSWL